MTYCHVSAQIDRHLQQLDADEELEDLAEAAGMTTQEFRAECERRAVDAGFEAATKKFEDRFTKSARP